MLSEEIRELIALLVNRKSSIGLLMEFQEFRILNLTILGLSLDNFVFDLIEIMDGFLFHLLRSLNFKSTSFCNSLIEFGLEFWKLFYRNNAIFRDSSQNFIDFIESGFIRSSNPSFF